MSGQRPGASDTLPVAKVLRNGQRILIRPVEENDVDLIRQGFAHLSKKSRFLRFLNARRELSNSELAQLTDADNHDNVALGAVDAASGDPVGLARFVRLEPDRSEAEIALTVVDAYQGLGVGTHMLKTLGEVAERFGVTHFVALVLRENQSMQGVRSTDRREKGPRKGPRSRCVSSVSAGQFQKPSSTFFIASRSSSL